MLRTVIASSPADESDTSSAVSTIRSRLTLLCFATRRLLPLICTLFTAGRRLSLQASVHYEEPVDVPTGAHGHPYPSPAFSCTVLSTSTGSLQEGRHEQNRAGRGRLSQHTDEYTLVRGRRPPCCPQLSERTRHRRGGGPASPSRRRHCSRKQPFPGPVSRSDAVDYSRRRRIARSW